MKIAFFSTKPYDRIWFEPMGKEYGFDIRFYEVPFQEETISLARGFDAVCIFVNDYVNADMIQSLYDMHVKAILLRSAGFNNVDVKAAEDKVLVLRVPSYSPEAVAEFAMGMLLTVNRYTHKAYNRTRDFNMSLNGLMGVDLYHKVAGIIGTGKIGQAMIRICNGFGMQVLAYDPYPNPKLDVEYVSLDEIMSKADVISLHCPLTSETKHIVNSNTIEKMKDGVYLVNTSRGALIDTDALIDGLVAGKFGGVGLDVYEEEEGIFYEDKSNEIMRDENLARLMTFPNVLITSHMGFFTKEATQAIAKVTLENAYALENGLPLVNKVGTEAAK
ncbi:2-hydroxyacid dehydrogenase [bacterium 0.1xD8-71]|nr:2-hydroxyacid dehydrogenase [bacterium 0.1xD8-71]